MMPGWQNAFRWIAYLLSSILIVYFAYHHSPWRDEAQAILLVADSENWSDLLQRIRFEGHPILWFAVIKVFGGSAVPLIHTAIALVINFLIVFKSKLPIGLGLFLPFSYFFLFEYAVIYRNYSIGILLLLLAVLFWRKNIKLTFAFLLLATQANFFAAVLSGVLIALLFEEYKLYRKWGFGVLALFTFTGLFYQLQVPEAGGFASGVHWSAERLLDACARLGQAYFPLQGEGSFTASIWNSSLFPSVLLVVLGLFTTVLLGVSLQRKYRLTFWLACGIILLIGTLKLDGFLRHYGHIWILFILMLCLSGQQINRLTRVWVIAILAVQIGAGFFIGTLSSLETFPFSQSKRVAQYLNEQGINHDRVAVFPDNYGTGISLESGAAYYLPNADTSMTHVIWNQKSQTTLFPMQLRDRLDEHFQSGQYFLLSPYYIPEMHDSAFSDVGYIMEWDDAVTDEKYFLFKIEVQ